MRLILLGSGEFGIPTFEHLVTACGHEVAAVVTQPDRPAGRKRVLTATPVGQWAASRGLTVFRQEDVNAPAFVQTLGRLHADASVVIAFGQKLSPDLIAVLGRLAVNLHGSLLPRHRGASPVHAALLAGDHEAGVSVIGLAQRMDAGEVYATASLTIERTETAGELHDRLAQLGGQIMHKVLNDLADDRLTPIPQNDAHATRAPKLSKADGWVDFRDDCFRVMRRIHGLNPWPGVRVRWCKPDGTEHDLILRRVIDLPDLSCFLPAGGKREPGPGTVMEGLKVACGDGAVRLLELQLPGGRAMDAEAFARGHGLGPGDRLVSHRP